MGQELKPYQTEGIAALLQFLAKRHAAYLADEMGLGKTVQAIRVSQALVASKVLITCPASLTLNWCREFEKWAPEREISVYRTGQRIKTDAVVVSYSKLARESCIKQLCQCGMWDLLILDEAHFCKNSRAARTRACFKSLWPKSYNRILLSGSPAPNGIIDLFTQFNACAPDLFPDRYKFGFAYTQARRNWFSKTWEFKSGRNLKALNELVTKEFYIRRRKSEVLKDLPPKIVQTVPIEISRSDEFEISADEKQTILSAIEGRGMAIDEHIATKRRLLGLAKAPAVAEYCSNLMAELTRLVVFTYHRETLAALRTSLVKKARILTIEGGISVKAKQTAIDTFQQADEIPTIILVQIQAGGMGINLHAANTCVIAELDWVPATIAQAIDRLHRIGQRDVVHAHFLVAEDTLDSDIVTALITKLKAINQL